MCNNSLTILIIIIVSAGMLGGLASHLSFLSTTETIDNYKRRINLLASIVIGICASFTIPLFLKILSSDLMNDMKVKEYLIFAGFCIIASFYAKTYLGDLYKKVNSLQNQVSENQKEIRSVDTKADTANTKVNDLSRQGVETKNEEHLTPMRNAIMTVKAGSTSEDHIGLLINHFREHPDEFIDLVKLTEITGLESGEVFKILEKLEQDAFLESLIGPNKIQMWKLKKIPITIHRAVYGSLNHEVDVTDKIRQLVQDNILDGTVDLYFLATHDPDPGVVKRLKIDCTIKGAKRKIAYSDGEHFYIR